MSLPLPVIPFSPSVAENYSLCHRKELYAHHLNVGEFSDAMHMGQALHAVARKACVSFQESGLWMGMDELIPLLRSALADVPRHVSRVNLDARVELWLSDLLTPLGAFVSFVLPLVPVGGLLGAEEWVRLDLLDPQGTVRAAGRIDMVFRVGAELWVLDLKTGTCRNEEEVDGALALALYVTAAQLQYPGVVVRGFEAYLNPFQRVEYDLARLPADLERLSALAHAHFAETQWAAHKGMHCHWCDFQPRCLPDEELL